MFTFRALRKEFTKSREFSLVSIINQVAKTLLEECNAEPDCVDYEGWTPLHAAALWGQKEAAALLLKYGADPHVKNYSVTILVH